MKTDLVEIFQTIRASLQPYAALGFSNRLNTDEVYDLWSDKNIEHGFMKSVPRPFFQVLAFRRIMFY